MVTLPLCLNFSSILSFLSTKHTPSPPSRFPCLSVYRSQRTGLEGRVQLGSTNTCLAICLLVCVGMVCLFKCSSSILLNLLLIMWDFSKTVNHCNIYRPTHEHSRHHTEYSKCVSFIGNFVTALHSDEFKSFIMYHR